MNFEKHSSFQEALRQAAINNDFQIIILNEDFNPILTVETRHDATIADAIRLGKERQVEKQPDEVYTMIDVNGVLTYWGPVNISGEKYFMFIVDNEDSYSAGDITKLAEIIELAMGMWKYTPERDARAEFIKALIRGNKSLAYSLQDEAGVGSDEIVSVFMGKGLEKGRALKTMDTFESAEELNIMKVTEDDEIYGLIINEESGEKGGNIAACVKCIKLFDRMKEDNTRHESKKTHSKAYKILLEELLKGHQGYVVAPLIEDSEAMEHISSAVSLHKEIKSDFKDFNVGLIYGGMN